MDLKLEVVVVPVSDIDRAMTFYSDKLSFSVDHDSQSTEDYRVIQLTSPASACSVVVQTGRPSAQVDAPPGSLQGLQLAVSDRRAARARFADRHVDISEVQVIEDGGFRPARGDEALDYTGFCFFNDPDGNGWALQQMPAIPGPTDGSQR